MAFTAELTSIWQIREGGQFGTGERTTAYRVGTIQVFGADRYMAQNWTLSAGLSAQPISIPPFGASAPGATMWLTVSDPVDVRFQSATDTVVLLAVRHLILGATISSLFLTTGSALTTVRIEMVGGSNASITTTLPS